MEDRATHLRLGRGRRAPSQREMVGKGNWRCLRHDRRPPLHCKVERQYTITRGWLDGTRGRLRQLLLLSYRGEDCIPTPLAPCYTGQHYACHSKDHTEGPEGQC